VTQHIGYKELTYNISADLIGKIIDLGALLVAVGKAGGENIQREGGKNDIMITDGEGGCRA
jgi:hypothetical protein